MEKFTKELEIGDIHQRDQWQVELKSEFYPHPQHQTNTYIQEFYFFIPNSLQVNEDFYSKQQFYEDETNFIRYKTPEFSLEELLNRENKLSPLTRLEEFQSYKMTDGTLVQIQDELKLFGNVARSCVRDQILALAKLIKHSQSTDPSRLEEKTIHLSSIIRALRSRYLEIERSYLQSVPHEEIQNHLSYIEEFIEEVIYFYLIGLLECVQGSRVSNKERLADLIFCSLKEQESSRHEPFPRRILANPQIEILEYTLYRSGLLNKFVLDALLLRTTRSSVTKRFRNLIGSLAAGIAMFFFFVFYVKQGTVLILNSLPFIILTVFLYIIKDRMKEWLQLFSYRQFAKWFSDYKTDIYSPDGKIRLGRLWEYMSFIEESELSKEIIHTRNREFHKVLESIKRPEKILYYKKKISLIRQKNSHDPRRRALNIISRHHIASFLKKADNPSQDYVVIDLEKKEFIHTAMPKVYHINLIQKNTFTDPKGSRKTELKKFRLIVDRNGIKRIETI